MFDSLSFQIRISFFLWPLCFYALPALSSEEERLWNIVKANSLDFNAWTALIEETEKAVEVSWIIALYQIVIAVLIKCGLLDLALNILSIYKYICFFKLTL